MCVYCMIGDNAFRHDPPWQIHPNSPWAPYIPEPAIPQKKIEPWDVDRLKEFADILKEVKDMEDKIGCPCEPNKADYLKLFKERIAELEQQEQKAQRDALIDHIALALMDQFNRDLRKFAAHDHPGKAHFWQMVATAAVKAIEEKKTK